jgi:hypothetical protein
MAVPVLGSRDWFGWPWWTPEWTVVAGVVLGAGALVLIVRAPTVPAALAVTGLQILGVYGIIRALSWPGTMPGRYYGVVFLDGADPARGTGLAGVERRLTTFDGILAVNSPPGGPTIVVIEVPCALSSAKTSSC